MADRNVGVVYHPLLKPGGPEEAKVLGLRKEGGNTVIDDLDSHLLDALAGEGHGLNPVLCGGGHPNKNTYIAVHGSQPEPLLLNLAAACSSLSRHWMMIR